ncbi:hypothetical protein BH24ACT11_BH24ACT11_16390 [soil metagenome]
MDHPVHQTIDRRSARQRIAEISSAAKPYPRWLVSVASGLVAAGMAILLRGDLLETVVAFVTTVLLDQTLRQLARRRIPGFYQQIAGALLATSVTLLLRALDVPVRPSIIIAASIVVLLAGVTIVGAVQDALTGYYVTASARTFEAALNDRRGDCRGQPAAHCGLAFSGWSWGSPPAPCLLSTTCWCRWPAAPWCRSP